MASPSKAVTASDGKKERSAGQSRRDWSALPEPALLSVAMSLASSLADVLAFGRVCRAWSSVAKDNERVLMSALPPLLFRDRNADFYCPADGRSYRNGPLKALLGGAEGSLEAVGCSFGHLIIRRLDVDPYCRFFSVVNPFTVTRACQFPPNYRAVLRWAVLSSPPASPDCFLLTFDGYNMEFCRLRDRKWTPLSSQRKFKFRTPPAAFLYGEGFLCCQGKLAVLDINPLSSESTVLQVGASAPDDPFEEMRLCVADAELLQIGVVHFVGSDKMKGFEVYRVGRWGVFICILRVTTSSVCNRLFGSSQACVTDPSKVITMQRKKERRK